MVMTKASRASRAATAFLFPLLLSITGCGRPAEAVVERFYSALAKGEITEAQTYLSSQAAGMMGQKKLAAALASESERIQKCGGMKSIDVQLQGEGEIRSGTAIVTYGGQCESKRESVKLIKEDGKWKLAPSK